ncbi:peptidase M24, structural domain-containing protein [Lineolata rhizophorae]|uniref:Peptidase M24, structural domain-containing protein n=1 Tax=Lineolata rhizophorae TaxID=578093 RepID=A0A6A6NPL3_9PEZI|nr:peptidase M24, structural domain-containing protein [Lineolata rhizophorae]
MAPIVTQPLMSSVGPSNTISIEQGATTIRKCAIHNLHQNLSFLDSAQPIAAHEFIDRRDRLAIALSEAHVDGFVLEPGYTFQYYANISQHDWEPWEPEERPFLMIIRPLVSDAGSIKADVSFLSPKFEEGRVRMLGIPSKSELNIITWEEHWNPYRTLREGLFEEKERVKLVVDEEIRNFLVRGLEDNGFETVSVTVEIDAVRQIKSPAEVEILRAVNTGTVEALRAMRPCLRTGLSENEVVSILDNVLLSAGFSLFFDIVLFEGNAALPHGGFETGNKRLTQDTMILIDVGARYLGYSSDICRSFFMAQPNEFYWVRYFRALSKLIWYGDTSLFLQQPTKQDHLHQEKLKVWHIVIEAQTVSAGMFKPNNTAASVDIAARSVITNAGYGDRFTHRVGHGIGIKAHESPYLNKGNFGDILQAGMTFTSEPGIYVTGKFGVRHEDVFLIKESGEADVLSGRRARGPYDP